jgi:hypothetical protein
MANPYVITCGLRRGVGHGVGVDGNGVGDAGNGVGDAGNGAAAAEAPEMFVYEFVGDLEQY